MTHKDGHHCLNSKQFDKLICATKNCAPATPPHEEPDLTIKEPNKLLDLALEQYKRNSYGRSLLTSTQAQQIARIINSRDDPRDTSEHCDSQFWYDPIPESTDDDLHVQEADPLEKGLYAAALNAVLNTQTSPSNMTQGFEPRIITAEATTCNSPSAPAAPTCTTPGSALKSPCGYTSLRLQTL